MLHHMQHISRVLLATSFAALFTLTFSTSAGAHPDAAHVTVSDAWIRATVPGQTATGGFMNLTAHENLRLVGVTSSAAGVAEIHEMTMKPNHIMEMRAIEGIDLPQGKTIKLASGGLHIMLMQLKQPLTQGSTTPVTLIFKSPKGETSKLHLKIAVAQTAPTQTTQTAPAAHPAEHKH